MSKRQPLDYNRIKLIKALYLAGYPAKDIGTILGEHDYKINSYLKKEEDLKMRTPIESRRVIRVPYNQLSDQVQELLVLYGDPKDLDAIYTKWQKSSASKRVTNETKPEVAPVKKESYVRGSKDDRGTFADLTALLKDCFVNIEFNTVVKKFTVIGEPLVQVKVPNDQGERTTLTLDLDNNEAHQLELKQLKQGSLRDIYYEASKTYEVDDSYEPSDFNMLNEYLKKMTSFLKAKYPDLSMRATLKLKLKQNNIQILFKLQNKRKTDKKV